MRRRSGSRLPLTAALFGRTSVLLLAVILGVGAIAYFAARDRVDDVYDGQLIAGANVLRALMSEELHEAGAPSNAQQLEVDDSALLSPEDRQAFDDYADWRMFRIWNGRRVLMRSDTGPPLVAGPAQDGFSEVRSPGGDRWRIYTLRVPNYPIVVQVGERTGIRADLVRRIALGTALPLLLLIPLIGGLLWLGLSDGLRALRELMDEIGRRSVRDLSLMPLAGWPRDLRPLVRTINRLFLRIEGAVQHERSFVDSAAHQLRTPLAAVKLQAQMLAGETDPQEREIATQRLIDSVDRATAMTTSLLTLARLDSQGVVIAPTQGDLRAETAAAIADLAPLAARRGVEIVYHGPEAAPAAEPVLLRLIAANLIENALHHAPPGSEVEVQLAAAPSALQLAVFDRGPGISPTERKKVLERFYRGDRRGHAGAGLGLSIVAEAVRVLNGELSLSDRPDGLRGLCARVELPSSAKV